MLTSIVTSTVQVTLRLDLKSSGFCEPPSFLAVSRSSRATQLEARPPLVGRAIRPTTGEPDYPQILARTIHPFDTHTEQ
jgi:hypothetical protein